MKLDNNFMETISVNSKISDVLFSVEESTGKKYCMLRKDNGELVGSDELFFQTGKTSLMKSLISKQTYHVCLYHRSSGEIVRRLKMLSKQQDSTFFKGLRHKMNIFYYRTIFSNLVVNSASFCNITNTVSIRFNNGRNLKLNLNELI